MGLEINFHKVTDALEKINKKLRNEVIDKSLEKGIDITLEIMKESVPKDSWELHDNLGELKHLRSGNGVNRKAVIGINSDDRDIIERGYYQEYGTTKMIGKKWIKKAFNKSIRPAKAAMAEEIKKNLKV